MELKTYQLLIDFGLVVLIFLVQLCIYPAFKYFSEENLRIWHRVYTPNITYVVFPLMLGQLGFSAYYVFFDADVLHWLHFILVLLTWLSTFAFFVPLHQKINAGSFNKRNLLQLEKGNWFRLILWALVFVISFFISLEI